jgi:hypothetical protein
MIPKSIHLLCYDFSTIYYELCKIQLLFQKEKKRKTALCFTIHMSHDLAVRPLGFSQIKILANRSPRALFICVTTSHLDPGQNCNSFFALLLPLLHRNGLDDVGRSRFRCGGRPPAVRQCRRRAVGWPARTPAGLGMALRGLRWSARE